MRPVRRPQPLQTGLLPAAAVLAAGILSCTPHVPAGVAGQPLVVFPPPPDTARIQFLTQISSSAELGGKRSPSFWQRLIGVKNDAVATTIVKPYGISVLGRKIYVCDTMLPGLDVVDLERRTIQQLRPRGQARLLTPINCFAASDGSIYVADTERHQVVVLSDSGTYRGTLGDSGGKPADVYVAGGRIWVTDLAAGKVKVYDERTRELLFAFPGAPRTAPEGLVAPANLHVTDRAVYVSDLFDARVKIYSLDGKYLRSVGSFGNAFGQFARPKGLTVDRAGNLYVVDAAFENVQVFDGEGRLLMFFGGGPYQRPGDMALPADVVVDYEHLDYFRRFVHPGFNLQYLIFVTNQYGPGKIGVYGFVGPSREAIAAK